MWAFPNQGSYKMKLREVYKDYSRFKSQSKKLKKWILQNFNEQKQNQIMVDSLIPNHKELVVSDEEFDDLFSSLV